MMMTKKATQNQYKLIHDMERVLNISFHGNTYHDADLFIKLNYERFQNVKKQYAITEKQMTFIKSIESVLNIKFYGKTKGAASRWIDQHIKEYNVYKFAKDSNTCWVPSWNHDPATEKQLFMVDYICYITGVKFNLPEKNKHNCARFISRFKISADEKGSAHATENEMRIVTFISAQIGYGPKDYTRRTVYSYMKRNLEKAEKIAKARECAA